MAIIGLITVCFPRAFFQWFSACIKSLESASNAVSISFDCDHLADVKALPDLVERLASFDVATSFACVGKLIEKHPREHSLLLEYGHEIVNHTYSHPFNAELGSIAQFSKLGEEEQKEEIMGCHRSCAEVLEYEPSGFRVPHFGMHQSDSLYSLLTEAGYAYSSSVLAVRSPSYTIPYVVGDIVELPVTTCPKHPFQAFDTYHAFRSRVTRHKDEHDFYEAFEALIIACIKARSYVNTYFDPQDVVKLSNFSRFLELIRSTGKRVLPYRDLLREISDEAFSNVHNGH